MCSIAKLEQDAGLRARTKQFIEFGLKISCNPCLSI